MVVVEGFKTGYYIAHRYVKGIGTANDREDVFHVVLKPAAHCAGRIIHPITG